MRFVFKMIVFPFWLITAFLALMLKWTLNLSAFVLALPMLYIFGCGLYTLYCREWMQFCFSEMRLNIGGIIRNSNKAS